MIFRPLGNTGMSVSELGLGCEHLEGKDASVVEATVHAALEGGMNIMDVFMSEPEVRTNIGRALRGRRHDVVVQGHIGACRSDGQYSVSRDIGQCREFFTDLLGRLETDYIDIGMIHNCDSMDELRAIEEGPVLEYAAQLKQQGVIRAIGLSTHNSIVADHAIRAGWAEVLMFSINPAYDLLPAGTDLDSHFKNDTFASLEARMQPDRLALYELCAERGVGLTVMKTFGGGLLLNAKYSPLRCGFTSSQLIAYALSRPGVSSALTGAVSPEQVEGILSYENASAAERDFAAALLDAGAAGADKACVYCNHCLPCPAGIDIAAVGRYLDIAEANLREGAGVPPTTADHYLHLAAHGSDCISCLACAGRCPFGVDAPARMARAAEIFGK